jgi:aspartyl protease family protein
MTGPFGYGNLMYMRILGGAVVAGLFIGMMMPASQPTPDTNQPNSNLILTPQTKAASDTNVGTKPHGYETVLLRHEDGHFYADAMVNGQLIHFLVDTGASMIALTASDAQKIGMNFSPNEFEVVGRGASGDVLGKQVTFHHVTLDNKEAWDLHGAVLADGLGVSLLGQNFLAQVGTVEIKGDQMILR